MAVFDIYTRVSEVGGRDGDSYGSPEIQEATARACALRLGLQVGEVVLEENVSGALDPNDRELGRLIARCERGDSAGIIFPRIDRLTRDVGVGGRILQRMQDAGARLISADGAFDSANLTPASEMTFTQLNAVAQFIRSQNRDHRLKAAQRASSRGVYLAKKPPLGYMRAEDAPNYVRDPARDGRRIVPDPAVAPLIREVFMRRAQGEPSTSLARWLNAQGVKVTASGVRHLLLNRAYVGEATRQSEKKGEPTVITNAHEPLLTEAELAAAQAKGGPYHPRDGSLAKQVKLPGLAYCATCGRRLQVGGSGRPGARKASYICTGSGKCKARVNIAADALDHYVTLVWFDALLAKEPHLVAVITGDRRYDEAVKAVEAARRNLEEYRDDLALQRDLGTKVRAEGLKPRKEALRLAQEALARLPPPATAQEDAGYLRRSREMNRRHIGRVVVKPGKGRGVRVPVEERVEVYFPGATEPYVPVGIGGKDDLLAAVERIAA